MVTYFDPLHHLHLASVNPTCTSLHVPVHVHVKRSQSNHIFSKWPEINFVFGVARFNVCIMRISASVVLSF